MTSDLSPSQEQFIHFANCVSRLTSALETLRVIKASHPENPLIASAFRFAIVEYVSSYTSSKGKYNKKYKLGNEYIPAEYLQLHKRLVTARHQIHAHFDLTIMTQSLLPLVQGSILAQK